MCLNVSIFCTPFAVACTSRLYFGYVFASVGIMSFTSDSTLRANVKYRNVGCSISAGASVSECDVLRYLRGQLPRKRIASMRAGQRNTYF